MRTVSPRAPVRKVDFYGQGVRLSAPAPGVAGSHVRAKRGEVRGWSSASRRRMRAFLLEHEPPAGWSVIGVTLTIPGPPLPDVEERAIWDRWGREVARRGWCAVWRLELQGRGSRHWHLVMSAPLDSQPFVAYVNVLWWECLDSIGPRTYDPPVPLSSGAGSVSSVGGLSAWPGADLRSCQCDTSGGSGAWYRYVCDHATKGKQSQVAESKGRHWGVLGRARYNRAQPSLSCDLTPAEYSRFLRAFQRLCTPHRPAACAFGCRLGFRPGRGRSGRSVWFSRPATVRRLVDWACGR